ncbi:hypothetical protein F5Y16DRAFT_384912 [Xylariaceae sp. FL0255]|nr:hypothetical protein F5Y16DRAFT_384912 [Xylariaceae sp. FL0255]
MAAISTPFAATVRPVGSIAQFNTARHILGLLRAVIVTCRYNVSTSHLRSLSLQTVVENALATVMMGQPILRVGIAGEETKNPVFVHLKTIDIRRMIEWKLLNSRQGTEKSTEIGLSGSDNDAYTESLLRSLEKAHECLWDDLGRKPGWKVIVHQDGDRSTIAQNTNDQSEREKISLDISFAFHHAYADGRSAYIFHADLQRALNSSDLPPPELQDHILHLAHPPAIPLPMETIVPLTVTLGFILRTVWGGFKAPAWVPRFLRIALGLEVPEDKIPWTGAPIDASNPRPHIRLLDLGNDAQIQSLLSICRAHDTSLTGLLHALIARSLARRLPKDVSALASVTPIAMAGYVDQNLADSTFIPGKTMHCMITGLSCVHDGPNIEALRADEQPDEVAITQSEDKDHAVWNIARDVTIRLRAKAASLPHNDMQGLARFVNDWHEFFKKRFGKPRDSSWELSNLGSLSELDAGLEQISTESQEAEDEGEGWSIDRVIFTQGSNATGAAFSLNVSGVAGQNTYGTITWQDGIVEVELMDGVAADLTAWTSSLAQLGYL